ncbi:MAG: hypothetical protein HQK78_17405 [Desulfobacterales bacterium]|nr:hypothetical protein [Desulfobacterales bacterium]
MKYISYKVVLLCLSIFASTTIICGSLYSASSQNIFLHDRNIISIDLKGSTKDDKKAIESVKSVLSQALTTERFEVYDNAEKISDFAIIGDVNANVKEIDGKYEVSISIKKFGLANLYGSDTTVLRVSRDIPSTATINTSESKESAFDEAARRAVSWLYRQDEETSETFFDQIKKLDIKSFILISRANKDEKSDAINQLQEEVKKTGGNINALKKEISNLTVEVKKINNGQAYVYKYYHKISNNFEKLANDIGARKEDDKKILELADKAAIAVINQIIIEVKNKPSVNRKGTIMVKITDDKFEPLFTENYDKNFFLKPKKEIKNYEEEYGKNYKAIPGSVEGCDIIISKEDAAIFRENKQVMSKPIPKIIVVYLNLK